MLRLMQFVVWIFLATCVGVPSSPKADRSGHTSQKIYVVSNGWHTGIVVRRAAIVAISLLPEVSDFPNAAFLEFGWGDREYYTAKEQPTIDMLARAGLTRTPAVMHVAGRAEDFSGRPAIRGTEIITLALAQPEFRRLVDAIARDFERQGGLQSAPISEGLTRSSFFYHARGEFHLLNTCNTWIAEKLIAGGIGLSSSGIVTASDLMGALRSAMANE